MGTRQHRRIFAFAISVGMVIGLLLSGEHVALGIASPSDGKDSSETFSVVAQETDSYSDVLDEDSPPSQDGTILLPLPRAHPLPAFLTDWQDTTNQGDYFEAIAPTPLGYLVWSRFPVTVFVAPSPEPSVTPPVPDSQVHERWHDAVIYAVDDWSEYVPLELVPEAENADIAIWAIAPPLNVEFDEAGLLLGRAQSAETRYEFYKYEQDNGSSVLLPKYEITIKPGQAASQIQATARHELGHALGLWGHSPSPVDALYYSQVTSPPNISPRDISTLKRVYQQPTQLGWQLPE